MVCVSRKYIRSYLLHFSYVEFICPRAWSFLFHNQINFCREFGSHSSSTLTIIVFCLNSIRVRTRFIFTLFGLPQKICEFYFISSQTERNCVISRNFVKVTRRFICSGRWRFLFLCEIYFTSIAKTTASSTHTRRQIIHDIADPKFSIILRFSLNSESLLFGEGESLLGGGCVKKMIHIKLRITHV